MRGRFDAVLVHDMSLLKKERYTREDKGASTIHPTFPALFLFFVSLFLASASSMRDERIEGEIDRELGASYH